MKRLLPYISLLGITFFILMLFPFGRNFFLTLLGAADAKRDNVVEEYERIKGTVDGVTEKISATEKKLNDTLETVNETKESIEKTAETMENFYESNEEKMHELAKKANIEAWRQSDPLKDISIAAGRLNYNFADPGPDGLAEEHLEIDLKPWIEWGNAVEDKTTKDDRIKALSATEYGRKVLDKLGYDY